MRGEKSTLATHLGVANICPSKRPATEEPDSCYSSRKVACLTGDIVVWQFSSQPNDTQHVSKDLNHSPAG